MDWFSALRKYKSITGYKGIAPKKGSREYIEVRRIMERNSESFKPKANMKTEEEPTETKVIRKYKKKVVVEETPVGSMNEPEEEHYEVEKPVKKIIKKKVVKVEEKPVNRPIKEKNMEVQTEKIVKRSMEDEIEYEKPRMKKKSMIVVPMYEESVNGPYGSDEEKHKVFIPPTVMKASGIPGRKDKLEKAELSSKKQPIDDEVNIVIANGKKAVKEGMVGFAMKKEKHCK